MAVFSLSFYLVSPRSCLAQIFPFCKDTNDVGLGPTLFHYDFILTNYTCNVPAAIVNEVPFWGAKG